MQAAAVTSAMPFADGATTTIHPSLIVCDDCDAVYRRHPLAPGTVAHCARCGASLGRGHRLGAQARLALMVAALIALRLWLLAPLAAGRRPVGFVPAMHALRWATRWSMVEVFLLGALIATVRSAGIASAVVGPGIFSYAVLTVLLAVEQAAGLRRLWRLGAELPR